MSHVIKAMALACLSLFAQPAVALETTGSEAFARHCRSCHSVKPGDDRLGPSLHGIYGARAEHSRTFAGYSGALGGLIWDDLTLDRFMADARSVSPGTTMIMPSVGDADERRGIIEYLKAAGAAVDGTQPR